MQPPLLVDEYSFARRHVAHQLERQDVQRHVLRGQHVFGAARGAPLAEYQRPDAIGVAKPEHAVADHHDHHGVAATAAPVHGTGRGKDIGRRHALGADSLQLGRQHVEQHFRIGFAVEVPAFLARQHVGQLGGVGQIAVVRQADAVGRIDVKRLHFGGAVTTRGRIADMADARVAAQLEHVMLLEDIAHQARALAHTQLTLIGGHDSGGVLAAVLQYGQCVIDALVDRTGTDNADYAAHGF